jgi:hypothetical protein
MKKLFQGIIIGFMACALLIGFTPIRAAIEEYICYKADYKLIINGQEFNDPDIPLLNYKGNTLAPVKKVFEAAGISVTWNAELGQAEATSNTTASVPEGSRIIDKTDYPFVTDENLIGQWQFADYVMNIADFMPGQISFKFNPYIKNIEFKTDGSVNTDTGNGLSLSAFNWTQNYIIHKNSQTCSSYIINDINGVQYLFFEWKTINYYQDGEKPWYYVMVRNNQMAITNTVTTVEENTVSDTTTESLSPIGQTSDGIDIYEFDGIKYLYSMSIIMKVQNKGYFPRIYIPGDTPAGKEYLCIELDRKTVLDSIPIERINKGKYIGYDYYINSILPLLQSQP